MKKTKLRIAEERVLKAVDKWVDGFWPPFLAPAFAADEDESLVAAVLALRKARKAKP